MRKLIFSIAIISFISSNLLAQHNFTMYNMPGMGQAHYENPAYFAKGKVYVGFGLGSHSFGVNHSGFRVNKVIQERAQDDSLEINQGNLLKSLKKRNYLSLNTRNEIIGFGININKNYFSFSVTNRLDMNFIYPKDLFVLALEGNGRSLLGERASLDGLGFHLNGYVEYALGYNRALNDKLRVGGRFKLLSGYANFTTKKSELGLTTNSETFDLAIDGRFKFSSAGLGNLFSEEDNEDEFDVSTFYSFKNMGIAFDLGATYALNDKIEVSASLLDLGFIRWKTQTANYETANLDFKFEGVDLNAYLEDESGYLESFKDTLTAKIDNDISSGAYTSGLSSRFYLGGKYEVTDWFTAGITSYNHVIANKLRSSFMLSGTIQLKNWLGFTMNYNNYGRSWGNIGAGVSLRGGPVQFYVMTDNLFSMNYLGAKNAHIAFGINLLIGKLDKSGKASRSSFESGE